VDPGLGLVLVHLPVPHPIGIYDRARHDFKTAGESSYLDNLELADRALGELRLAMESAGLWDSSTVVVSGDHWWRAEVWSRLDSVTNEEAEVMPATPDHRVPFLVKLAGQKEPLAFTPEMNTILTHDLLLAVLRGEVRTPQEAAAWLDQHRTVGDVPHNIIKR
jgi:arylsulfatase A-like enzyme